MPEPRNHLLRFEVKRPKPDFDQSADVWLESDQQWVSLKAASGQELIEAQQRVAEVTHIAGCAYSPRIKAEMRARSMRDDCRLFDIGAVYDPDDKRRDMVMLLTERTDGVN